MYQPKYPHPLAWPVDKPRRPDLSRMPSSSSKSFEKAWDDLAVALEDKLGATDITISTNVGLYPGSLLPQPHLAARVRDPGAAVYFTMNGRPYAIACDAHSDVKGNLIALTAMVKSLNAIRMIDEMLLAQTLEAWRSYPPPFDSVFDAARRQAEERAAEAQAWHEQREQERQRQHEQRRRERERQQRRREPPWAQTAPPWWVVLGVAEHAPADEVERAYRKLALQHHPDRGGDPEAFIRVTAARDAARQARG